MMYKAQEEFETISIILYGVYNSAIVIIIEEVN